jgi:hypothetical protein
MTYGKNVFEKPLKEKDKEPAHPRQPGYVEQPKPGSLGDKLKQALEKKRN